MSRGSPPSAGRSADDVHLTIDANQSYTPKAAIAALNRMAEYRIDLVEQPVAADDFDGPGARHRFGPGRPSRRTRRRARCARSSSLCRGERRCGEPEDSQARRSAQHACGGAALRSRPYPIPSGCRGRQPAAGGAGAALACALPGVDYACELGEFDRLLDDPFEGLEVERRRAHSCRGADSGVRLTSQADVERDERTEVEILRRGTVPKHPSSGQYAIIGLGVVAGQQPDRSERMIASEAARLAIEDAGLTPKDMMAPSTCAEPAAAAIGPATSTPFTHVSASTTTSISSVGRGGALAGLGIAAALSFLDRGIANYVCLMGAVTDWSQAQESRKQGHRGMAHAEKAGYWGKALGDLRAVSHHSWMAARHMAVYGTTSRQLGAISVAAARLGVQESRGEDVRPADDHRRSSEFAADGRALPSARPQPRVRRRHRLHPDHGRPRQGRPQPPVYVLGQGFGEVSSICGGKRITSRTWRCRAGDQAFGQAELTLDDVDAASSTTASPPRSCSSSRTTDSARRARAAPSWSRARSDPAAEFRSTLAAGCCPAIISAI